MLSVNIFLPCEHELEIIVAKPFRAFHDCCLSNLEELNLNAVQSNCQVIRHGSFHTTSKLKAFEDNY